MQPYSISQELRVSRAHAHVRIPRCCSYYYTALKVSRSQRRLNSYNIAADDILPLACGEFFVTPKKIQKTRWNMDRLLFSALLLSALQHSVLADTTRSSGGSRSKLTEKLEEMCTKSFTKFYDRLRANPAVFRSWEEEIRPLGRVDRRQLYFHHRPVDSKL